MKSNLVNIKTLFIRLSEGDVEAYDEIFRNYYVSLVTFSNSFIHDRESAEDIVSDVFCNLWINREKYKSVIYGQSYLFSSVKNGTLDFLRNKKKVSVEPILQDFEDVDHNFIDIDFLEIDIYSRLNNIISTLPPKCGDILKLKLDGMNDKEISERIGVKFETVRSHQKRGFVLIRNKMDKIYSIILLT